MALLHKLKSCFFLRVYFCVFPKIKRLGPLDLCWMVRLWHYALFKTQKSLLKLVCIWKGIKAENYFTIQLIFATIYRLHCTF